MARHRAGPPPGLSRSAAIVIGLLSFSLTTALAVPGESPDRPWTAWGIREALQPAVVELEPESGPVETVVEVPEPMVHAMLDPTVEQAEGYLASTTTTLPGAVLIDALDTPGVWNTGVELLAAVPAGSAREPRAPESPWECYQRAKAMDLSSDTATYDRNRVAQMTHGLFGCMTSLYGLDDVRPANTRWWNGERTWGFQNLSQQVAAESVVVAYCETSAFDLRALTRNNPFGYGGLFQMGTTEMVRFGPVGGSKFDPVDNAMGAATYFLHQYRNRAGWGGWSPWAVVNTNFDDEVNNQVKIPILPRFTSSDPDFRGRRGPELPAWAVDPWTYEVPSWRGCPYAGGRWAAAVPLEG